MQSIGLSENKRRHLCENYHRWLHYRHYLRCWEDNDSDMTVRNSHLEANYQCGLSLRNESLVIRNLMGNAGGRSSYPEQFLKGLNEYAVMFTSTAILLSPPIAGACCRQRQSPAAEIECKREWRWEARAFASEGERPFCRNVLYFDQMRPDPLLKMP